MQRGIATIVTLVFGWLLVLPVFASSAELTLPPCCRKNGKHHCMMGRGGELAGAQAGLATITVKCPYCPYSTTASNAQFSSPAIGDAVFAGLVQHPAVSAQTEAVYRISYERSRHKRGPPSLILFF
ncbi:MAG: hypothetical protein WA324_18090 [Bryobacteraceae bacterium]